MMGSRRPLHRALARRRLASAAARRDLVVANRILAAEGVVDAFGHVSIRTADGYLLSRARAPALIEEADLVEFYGDGRVKDPERLAKAGWRPYAERAIHGAVYEARPDVGAVVHNHAYDVIPFAVTTGTPLRPMTHTCAPIGSRIPVWDIREKWGKATNHLVVDADVGRDLAKALGGESVVLMKRHGAVVAQASLKAAVMTAVYLQNAALMQKEAVALGGAIDFLTDAEVAACAELQLSPIALDRAWEMWAAKVEGGLPPPHAGRMPSRAPT